jgi:hypothetical protein
MAIDLEINNFYNYIHANQTENTSVFKETFPSCISELPNYTCSSKIIYEILKKHTDIHTNWIKQKVFRDTFNEYFRWKLLGSI